MTLAPVGSTAVVVAGVPAVVTGATDVTGVTCVTGVTGGAAAIVLAANSFAGLLDVAACGLVPFA